MADQQENNPIDLTDVSNVPVLPLRDGNPIICWQG